MSRIKLDLRHFSHVGSDDHTTTLKHKDGHELKIANKALSPDSREQLEALAKAAAKPEDKGVKRHEDQVAMAKGGKVEKKSPETIMSHGASDGVEAANAVRKDRELPNGATIMIVGKDRDKNFGKVTGPDGTKPEVFAQGGAVQEYAEGTDDVQPVAPPPVGEEAPPIADALKFDPTAEATGPEAYSADPAMNRKREKYNAIVGAGNPDPSQAGSADAQNMMFGRGDKPPVKFDPAAWTRAEQMYQQEESDNSKNAMKAQQGTIAENNARVAAGLPPLQVPNVPQGPQIPGSEMGAQPAGGPDQLPPTAQQQAAADPMQMTQDLMMGGYQKQMAGINAGAEAQGQMGREQEAILQKQVQSQQDAQVAYKQNYDKLEAERQAHMQDIKDAHIDPNKYWTGDKDGNGSHSKLMSGIGMILAGFNPTGAPNAAINYLNHQMEMNLNAQKENLGSQQNLLSANLRQFGNLKDATDMTRLMQSDIVRNQLMEAAAKAQTPMAKAAAMQAAGQLQQQFAPLQMQMAMRRSMMQLSNGTNGGDPSDTHAAEQMIAMARMTNPEMAKEMEGRLIPGVGMAKIPVPQDVRQQMVDKQSFGKLVNKLQDFAKKHQGSLDPQIINEGRSLAAEVQGAFRIASKGGTYKEGEQEFIEQLVPSDPTQFFANTRTLAKLKPIVAANESSLNTLKSGYGLPQMAPQQAANDPKAAQKWAMANPKDPRAAQILQHLQGK